jgi:hypothetical protein
MTQLKIDSPRRNQFGFQVIYAIGGGVVRFLLIFLENLLIKAVVSCFQVDCALFKVPRKTRMCLWQRQWSPSLDHLARRLESELEELYFKTSGIDMSTNRCPPETFQQSIMSLTVKPSLSHP